MSLSSRVICGGCGFVYMHCTCQKEVDISVDNATRNTPDAECKHCGVVFLTCCDHRCFCGETGSEDDYYWDEYRQRVLKEKCTDV
jgi:hypothetical protein